MIICFPTRVCFLSINKEIRYFSFRNTFHYDPGYWSVKSEYNLPGGEPGFDAQENNLPTYWNTSFIKICFGMKIGQQINFIVINKPLSRPQRVEDADYIARLLTAQLQQGGV